MIRMTETVKQLLIINIIIYVGSNIIGDMAYQLFSQYSPVNPNFRYWQLLTNMFMHSPIYGTNSPTGIMHLVLNMFALVSFGSTLEQLWGAHKFLFFYISCGLGATLLHIGFKYYEYNHILEIVQQAGLSSADIDLILKEGKVNSSIENLVPITTIKEFYLSYNGIALGASGAIYGLLVAFAFLFPTAELGIMFIPVPVKAKYFVPGLLTVDLILGLKGNSIFGPGGTGIAHFAHLGGALIGFIMMWYWKKNQFNNKRWN